MLLGSDLQVSQDQPLCCYPPSVPEALPLYQASASYLHKGLENVLIKGNNTKNKP